MPLENVKRVLSRYFEMWNSGQVDIAEEILSPSFVDRGHPDITSIEMLKAFVQKIRSAMPDFRVDIHCLISEGNMAALEGTVSRTQKGEYTVSKVMWFARIEHDRMVELRTGTVNHS